MTTRHLSSAAAYVAHHSEDGRSVSAAAVYVAHHSEDGRSVSAAAVYVAVIQRHERHLSSAGMLVAQVATSGRNVSDGHLLAPLVGTGTLLLSAVAVYVAVAPGAAGVLIYNGIVLDEWLDEFSLDAIAKAIDVSNFASEGAQHISSLPRWTLDVGGPWSPALDDILGPDAVRSLDELRSAQVQLEGVRYEWIPTPDLAARGAILSNYRIISQPNGAIQWTATLTCSHLPQRTLDA